MCRKKIAIYVEGQTEQILINHLILTWWEYSGIRIQNLKLLADQNKICPVKDFLVDTDVEISFLITNVEGVGSLASAIASRANIQHENGFEIIGLRDLYAEDYTKELSHSMVDPIKIITDNFRTALKIKNCRNPEKIDLFFAIMEVEAWLLAFTTAISKWVNITEENILQKIRDHSLHSTDLNLEIIKRPSTLIKQLGKLNGKEKSKSFDAIMSIVAHITRHEIHNVYHSYNVPSFNRFWNKLLFLSHQTQHE